MKGPFLKFRASAGFSLVEVVIAMAILAIAFFGMVSVVTYTSRMNAGTRERVLAMRAAERKIEQMLANTDLGTLFANFSDYSAAGEGKGWEQVQEIDQLGIAHPGLLYYPPTPQVPGTVYNPASGTPCRQMPTGYLYPAPLSPTDAGMNGRHAVLFVRFPLGSATMLNEAGAGTFAGLPAADLDLNRDGIISGSVDPATVQVLPVVIEVYWKSAIGNRQSPGYLNYKYIFLKKT
jgi:prepilin-type N-terminal cleavage/methylation domain-containing protein